jgi:hypothetical protein
MFLGVGVTVMSLCFLSLPYALPVLRSPARRDEGWMPYACRQAGAMRFFIRLRQDTLSRFSGTAGRNGEATAP